MCSEAWWLGPFAGRAAGRVGILRFGVGVDFGGSCSDPYSLQNLASALDKPVVAPNNYVFYRPDGTTYLADANLSKSGAAIPNTVESWLVFFPQGGGK